MQVLVGGAVVGEWDVTASSQTYDVSSQVEVDFTNDICSGCNGGTPVGGGDRNLYVNSVTVNGTIVHPGDPGPVGPRLSIRGIQQKITNPRAPSGDAAFRTSPKRI